MLLLLQDLSVQTIAFVPESFLFVFETEQSLILLLLHNQSVQPLLIVGSSMKLIGDAEMIFDDVTASRSICSNLAYCCVCYERN